MSDLDPSEFNNEVRQAFAEDPKADQLGVKNQPGIVTRDVITEQEISKTYLSARTSQVSYGTYQGRPAALIVIDFVFHSADHKNQRFKEATIEIDFTEPGSKNSFGTSAELGAVGATRVQFSQGTSIAQFAPKLVYGEKKAEEVTWLMDVSVGANLVAGPVTLEVANSSIARETKYSRDHRLEIKGSARGSGPSRLYWSLAERKHDGIPPHFTTAFMVFHPRRTKFSAAVNIKASIGFSMDIRRWGIFLPSDDRMNFHEDYPKGAEIDPDFDRLDLTSFYKERAEKFNFGHGALSIH